jgi:hypothetical protein
MDKQAVDRFCELLNEQSSGDSSAIERLRRLNVSLTRGHCLCSLYQEWVAAFSYSPGRVDALAPIRSLAEKIRSFARDDTLRMYEQPEWKRLTELRGPANSARIYGCSDCGCEFTTISTSGFVDLAALVCPDCGDVYFKSYHDETKTPACPCGSHYSSTSPLACSGCQSKDVHLLRELSLYHYFDEHHYTIAD